MKWFKHSSSMRHDPKVRRVIRRYGAEGYALYCYILESVAEGLSEDSPVPALEETSEDIAEILRVDSRRIEEMATFMASQRLFGFIDGTETVVVPKIIDHLDEYSRKKGHASPIRKALYALQEREEITYVQGATQINDDEILSPINKQTDDELFIDQPVLPQGREPKQRKHKYGEYKHVLLTDEERDRLIVDWGESKFLEMVKKLDEGIELKGYKYKSHNLALRKWESKETEDVKKTPEIHRWRDESRRCSRCGRLFEDGEDEDNCPICSELAQESQRAVN